MPLFGVELGAARTLHLSGRGQVATSEWDKDRDGVELAWRTHRCDEGETPPQPHSTWPKYLESLPMDPFSGKPA